MSSYVNSAKIRLDKARAALKEAEAQYEAERKLMDSLTTSQVVADILHSAVCKINHTDGCGYHYEDWKTPRDSREMWLKRAEKFIANLGNGLNSKNPEHRNTIIEAAEKFVELLHIANGNY